MSKITIAGEAVVVTSEAKLEELQKVAKYRPNALVLYGGEDGKEPIFSISVCNSGDGNINRFGVEFSHATHDEAKLATVTIVHPYGDDVDIKAVVADKIGAYVLNLNKLEETLPSVMNEIAAEKAQILANITVAQ